MNGYQRIGLIDGIVTSQELPDDRWSDFAIWKPYDGCEDYVYWNNTYLVKLVYRDSDGDTNTIFLICKYDSKTSEFMFDKYYNEGKASLPVRSRFKDYDSCGWKQI